VVIAKFLNMDKIRHRGVIKYLQKNLQRSMLTWLILWEMMLQV